MRDSYKTWLDKTHPKDLQILKIQEGCEVWVEQDLQESYEAGFQEAVRLLTEKESSDERDNKNKS